MNNELHAHVDASLNDCDGRITQEYVIFFNDAERAESGKLYNDFSDIHFMERVLGDIASPYPYTAPRTTVEIDEDGFHVTRQHEEGVNHIEVEWCRKDCPDTYLRRDHRAESMNY